MKPELKTKWITALRSGNYAQVTGYLRKEDATYSYCCLGVLCDIIDPNGWSGDEWFSEDYCEVDYGQDGQIFPECQDAELDGYMLEQVGLSEKIHAQLIHLNDDEKQDFKVIADYIEREVPTT